MALPPKGDPRRPLWLAIRSCRLLGIVWTAIGSLVLVIAGAAAGNVRAPARTIVVIGFVSLFCVGPGILFIILAIFLKRRRAWAVTTGIVVASLECLLGLLMTIGMLLTMPETNFVGLFIALLVTAAMGQLVYHLSQSYKGLNYADDGMQRGFEPIPFAAPVVPRPPDDTRGTTDVSEDSAS